MEEVQKVMDKYLELTRSQKTTSEKSSSVSELLFNSFGPLLEQQEDVTTSINEVQPFNFILEHSVKQGQLNIARWTFDEMKLQRITPNEKTLSHLFQYAGKAESKDLFSLLDELQQQRIQLSLSDFNAMMESLAKNGNSSPVVSLFDYMNKNGIKPDVKTFASMMKTFGNKGDFDDMMIRFERMKNDKVKPDVAIFNIIINSYGLKVSCILLPIQVDLCVGSC